MLSLLQKPKTLDNSLSRLLFVVYTTAFLTLGCIMLALSAGCYTVEGSFSSDLVCPGRVGLSGSLIMYGLAFLGSPILMAFLLKRVKVSRPWLITIVAYSLTAVVSIIYGHAITSADKRLPQTDINNDWRKLAVAMLLVVLPFTIVITHKLLAKKGPGT